MDTDAQRHQHIRPDVNVQTSIVISCQAFIISIKKYK